MSAARYLAIVVDGRMRVVDRHPWSRRPGEWSWAHRLRVWWLRLRCEHAWAVTKHDGLMLLRCSDEDAWEWREHCEKCWERRAHRIPGAVANEVRVRTK